ncbi:hypothetical protein GCM10027605_46970 [Micromonospora zhanjiangensis]
MIGLRPATTADSEFCYRLHRAAMRDHVAAVWGWDEAEQRGFHERQFDPTRTMIVTVGGRDAGALTVEYRPTEIYLARIELALKHQGRGIGTRLIRQLLAEGAARRQSVLLDVLAINHRAYALYERLGFRVVARHGDNDVKIRMCADPADGPS